MRHLAIIAAALLLPFASVACSQTPTPSPIVDAERAFAADGYARGVKASFLEYSALDAIVLAPDPVNAHESLSKEPDLGPGEPTEHLVWWPLWAGIARSGDLGFTTGPAAIDEKRFGHYFTVWKLQPDGRWKWVFDGGVGTDPSAEDPQGSPVSYLPVAASGSASPEAALAEVADAEKALAAEAQTDLAGALAKHLAPDARIHSQGRPPAKSASEHAGAIAARAAAMTFASLGGGASKGGDLVWTYGGASWSAEGAGARGHYVRIWQKRAEGWRLVFDQVAPFRGPPTVEGETE